MMSDDVSQFFILLVKKTGKKKDKYMISLRSSSRSKSEVLAGTLLFLIEQSTKRDEYIFVLETFETGPDANSNTIQLTCIPGEAELVERNILDLLISIPNCAERLAVYQDKEWLSEAQSIKLGDRVFVKMKNHDTELEGTVRYRGRVPDSDGIFFGIELDQKGLGTCDGMFRKEQFFTCPPDSAVFCAVHRIRKRIVVNVSQALAKQSVGGQSFSMDEAKQNLKIGDRVVWMSDHGPESGSVKWIGTLPLDNKGEITVGVEFDEPVGSGTGKYKEHRLFFAKQNHASLIPLLGLLKEDEFYSPGSANTAYPVGGPMLDIEGSRLRVNTERLDPMDCDNNEIGLKGVRKSNSLGKKGGHVEKGMNPLYEFNKIEGIEKSDGEKVRSLPQKVPNADPDLSVDSMVEVLGNPTLYGVIRWIGATHEQPYKQIAGLEMEKEISAGTDGTFKGERFFHCAPKRALFVPLYKCKKDQRFPAKPVADPLGATAFGSIPTQDIDGSVSPPSSLHKTTMGLNKGIQGHHNSCYLDATLFAMYSFTTVFDGILHRPRNDTDLKEYNEVQRVLKDMIVNPLRTCNYVRADKVMKFRELLDKFGKISGMMSEEKDPEEFLHLLLTQIMKSDPLLHLSSGEDSNFYQLFIEKDELLLLPTTQKLIELSFIECNVKLKEVPSCLIIQMPRFGKEYKMFRRIIPSLELDITDLLEEGIRECIICGDLATVECISCYQLHGPGLNATAFCDNCNTTNHQHKSRRSHKRHPIHVSKKFEDHWRQSKRLAEQNKDMSREPDIALYREKMELFAVLCIQTSHYVSFVKCGTGTSAPWVFFDSMADRMGEQSGYNIPEVTEVKDVSKWLSTDSMEKILKIENDKDLPIQIRRLLCDAYMCFYQSTEVSMFK
ncbi:ubiquitin carboxyl-terminal hydrolase CYLD-like [Gigantopelta aegis]|uniref:ubiquitin carboxyl-terminal hydrolase CYLD-like n=1 Tax=Gigantopelta aegis TaxID=1735272 RepID=UPI001B88A995|nr:ubiquitin carboxyl-terminal hydrolase CYLD-like [Gigantopelta aegis]